MPDIINVNPDLNYFEVADFKKHAATARFTTTAGQKFGLWLNQVESCTLDVDPNAQAEKLLIVRTGSGDEMYFIGTALVLDAAFKALVPGVD